MTPFGAPQPQQQADAGGERFEERNVVIIEGDEKQTQKGKVYWRVKDSNNHWYSVWEAAVKIRLETAADNQEAVRVAVKITPPSTPGKQPFYTIVATDNAVDSALTEGASRAVANTAPGGKNSAFNRRMHPDDALRVTNLACQERAIQMVALTIVDKPDAITAEQWVKGKLIDYVSFLSSLLAQPLTLQPETVDQATTEAAPEDPSADDDIPF